MIALHPSALTSSGHPLSMEPADFGLLTDSRHLLHDPAALRQQMEEEGYLYIKDFFPVELIREARQMMLHKLTEAGFLNDDPQQPEGTLKPGVDLGFLPGIAQQNPAIHRVVFGPEIHEFYKSLLDCENIRHFDYIWVRTMGHGKGTPPHCDIVYMGRGTHNLYTAWIPYGDVPFELGGLMILEQSHRQADRIRNYLNSDVDSYCESQPDRDGWTTMQGALSRDPVSLRQKFGGRWLTAEFGMGDLLTFRMDTIHASTDNQTQRVRLSTDTRYQRSHEPVDERWVGENPIGHGKAGKRGRIC